MLPDSKTYQQYMTAGNVMKKTMIFLHDSIKYKWMIELFSSGNELGVNHVCQHINLNLYNLFCVSHDSEYGKGQFHLCMVKEMQKGTESCFEYIFKEYLLRIYIDHKCNRLFCWLIINRLKEFFFTQWKTKVIIQMKSQIETITGSTLTNLKTK